ncbi:hypothetical protein DBV10_22590, partial [Acidovorax sp. FJL06]
MRRRWTSFRRPCAPSTASPTWSCGPCGATCPRRCTSAWPPTRRWRASARCWGCRRWPGRRQAHH